MFGRRRGLPAALPDDGEATRWAPTSIVGQPVDARRPNLEGQTGWAPFGSGQHPSDQVGAYAAPPLTGYPSLINDAQKLNGVSGLDSGWYTPSRTYALLEQGTQFSGSVPNPANNVGGQRRGMPFSGLLGPISARLMRGRVTAAAVQQTQMMGDVSSLIMSWAPPPVVVGSEN